MEFQANKPKQNVTQFWRAIYLGIGIFVLLTSLPDHAAADCVVPDLPVCACYDGRGQWPMIPTLGYLIATAKPTVGTRESCTAFFPRHGGQPYWQVVLQIESPELAHIMAHLNLELGVSAIPRTSWCTETVALWALRANVPYLWGYYTYQGEGVFGNYLSTYAASTRDLRTWYKTQERLVNGRGRWLHGCELDHVGFIPGVNGPCPGAYQQIFTFQPAGGEYASWRWAGGAHSQVIDSMVVYRLGDPTGPVQRIDVHMIEGNSGQRIRNERWYRDIIQFTTLGPDSAVLDGWNRKIRGWGINLDSDGNVLCDSSRIQDVVIFTPRNFPPPLVDPNDPDSALVEDLLIYETIMAGYIPVTCNSQLVQTGGTLPTPTSPWVIPPVASPPDTVYIDIDLRANHPLPVEAVTFEWVEGIPSQFQVWWSSEQMQIHKTAVIVGTPAPPVPTGAVLPFTVALTPDTSYVVRYVRLCLPSSELTETFIIQRFHLNFHGTEIEDYNETAPLGDAVATAVVNDPVPAGLRLMPGFPNPFKGRTSLSFTLPREGPSRLVIYDVLGRHVRTLFDGVLPAGSQTVSWDGRNERGVKSPSGVYFVKLDWGSISKTQKLILMR